jgi:hypothetical protein
VTAIDPAATYVGGYGRLDPFTPADDVPNAETTTFVALITAPPYHPAWSQYSMYVIDLTPRPGYPDASLNFPGATHELVVTTVDPRHGVLDVEQAQQLYRDRVPFHLTPINIVHQFQATDDEMRQVAWLCGRAVVLGQLNPETADAPTRIREEWLQACVLTLAHLRGEEHAGHGN